jgi:hypothetical protein
VKLRGRTTTPDRRRGRTISSSARVAKQEAFHGPLQRLLAVAEKKRQAAGTWWRTEGPQNWLRQRTLANHNADFTRSCYIGYLRKCANKNLGAYAVDSFHIRVESGKEPIHRKLAIFGKAKPVNIRAYDVPTLDVVNSRVTRPKTQRIVQQVKANRFGCGRPAKVHVGPFPDELNAAKDLNHVTRL